MRILAIAQLEDRANLDKQIAKQTVQPNELALYIDDNPAKTVDTRRKRIAENHKYLVDIVKKRQPDLVWQLEQDVDLKKDCLEMLVRDYERLSPMIDFGYISGIQVGRHGLYHIGAWKNFTADGFESINHHLRGYQEVDATGFYCLLAPTDVWLSGKVGWNGEPYGPDVVWGRSIRQKKFVNMENHVGHIVKRGIIRPEHQSTITVKFFKNDKDEWKFKTYD